PARHVGRQQEPVSLVRALERGDEEPRERVAVRDDERDLLERRAVDGRLLDRPADGGVDLLLDARVLLDRDGAVGAGGTGRSGRASSSGGAKRKRRTSSSSVRGS